MDLNRTVISAFGLILLAAAMNGAYAIPLRFMSRWKWENAWALWTLWSMVVLPGATAAVTIPGLGGVYAGTSPATFAMMAIFGAMWGVGVLLIGLSFPLVGVAVGNAVALGSAAAVGSLLPLLGKDASRLGTPSGRLILLGILVLLAGIGLCGWAGRARELRRGGAKAAGSGAIRGALIACLGGCLTSFLNAALAYGDSILDAVRAAEPGNVMAANAVWLPVLLAGGAPGLLHCLYRMRRNRSYDAFRREGTAVYWLLTVVMAGLWFASVLLYGLAVLRIGTLGPVIGWPVFMSGAVVSSFVWSALAGEWKKTGARPSALMAAGASLLLAAMVLFAKAGAA
jgi:L-rhamnose-H+ transport protein